MTATEKIFYESENFSDYDKKIRKICVSFYLKKRNS